MRLIAALTLSTLGAAPAASAVELTLTDMLAHKAFRVPAQSLSMVPTIRPGEIVYVDRSAYASAQVRVGDIVVLRSKNYDGAMHIRRVVAIGGEVIKISDGKLHVNEDPVAEPYVHPDNATGNLSKEWGPRQLPTRCIFVLGDNRDQSRDSRLDDCYAASDILGKVRYVTPSLESRQAREPR